MAKHSRLLGMAATTVAIVLLIGIFWGFGWFAHPGSYLMSTKSEDYVKDLFTTTYHVAYDDEATQCRAMNYPYGEYHTFSGLQPLVATPLRILKHLGVDHAEQAVLPITNSLILLSIVLCALLLYLLLCELSLPWWYSALAALLLTLLSPQLQRMGGHITLAYYCAVPALLYLSLRHARTAGMGWAAALGVCAFLFGLCHPYYMVFYLVASLFTLVWQLTRRGEGRWSTGKITLSAVLQVIVPLALFFLATHIGLDDGNRTSVPSGLMKYRGRLLGLLLPYGRPYYDWGNPLFIPIEWEAMSFLGVVPVAALVALLWCSIRSLVNKKYRGWRPTESSWLNVMLLAAVLLTIYAFGFPLGWLPRNLPCYLGPLAQIRATGRLVWMLYYVMGVVAFVMLYRWYNRSPHGWRRVVLIAAFILSAADATAYNYRNHGWYTQRWDEWTDYDNRLATNQWVGQHDWSQYQAVLTLPVFNIGSEHTYLPPAGNMFHHSALISIKTGLPLVCNESSRSDIDQAWQCIATGRTAWANLPLADALPNSKPLLLAVAEDTTLLSEAERRLLNHAEPLDNLGQCRLYALPVTALQTVVRETQTALYQQYNQCIDTGNHVLNTNKITVDLRRGATIMDTAIGFTGKAELSFWLDDILTDMIGRTQLMIEAFDDSDKRIELFNWSIGDFIDLVDFASGQGLLRTQIDIPYESVRIKASLRNRYTKPHTVGCHNVLLRPIDQHVAFHSDRRYIDNTPVIYRPGYVSLQDGHFAIDGKRWFPVMLNYKAEMKEREGELAVVPAPWYTGGDIGSHFDTIAAWGFNAVRVCLDRIDRRDDTAAMYRATQRMVQQAAAAGLHVMLLIEPPLDDYWRQYTIGLMKRLADQPALWAYDLMNEPLYFDPEKERSKESAAALVKSWRKMVRQYAPNQLFTVALAEPIEVFEWDPSLLPVDFIEMHTYHPLRVRSEMWWYSHHCGKPWMIGETGLPADGDRVPYEAQARFMLETYRYATQLGAIGYGWWEFQDYPEGVNFEAQYTGLRDSEGRRKPAVATVGAMQHTYPEQLFSSGVPCNYYNMLAYANLATTGAVVDQQGKPIEGAVIRGWNKDWSVGINTFSDSTGRFRLVSNDVCTHFEISAPGYSKVKFDQRVKFPAIDNLPEQDREYQQLPLLGWGPGTGILPQSPKQFEAPTAVEASIGTIKLSRL